MVVMVSCECLWRTTLSQELRNSYKDEQTLSIAVFVLMSISKRLNARV